MATADTVPSGKGHYARTPAIRAKNAAALIGRKLLDETRAKISASLTGNTRSPQTRDNIRDANRVHGMYGTPVYNVWRNMLTRCRQPNNPRYPDYGGRGISVCERWLTFQNFYDDMGDPPPGMSIDRIDNDGNYEPSNCRWATPLEQRHNQRVGVHTPRTPTTDPLEPRPRGVTEAPQALDPCACRHSSTDHIKQWHKGTPRPCVHYDNPTMSMCPCEEYEPQAVQA